MTQTDTVEGEGTKVAGSYLIWRSIGGSIRQIQHGNTKIAIGQRVIANGRITAAEDTLGLVVKLHEPYANGLTTDVIEVFWEGDCVSQYMKFKDLKF